MQKVVPYKTKRNAIKALDNGGRFFNLLTRAEDGEIEASELARVAGAFSDRQKMFLYLEMSLAELDPARAREVRNRLSPDLKDSQTNHQPVVVAPAKAIKAVKPSQSAIVTGVPSHVESKSQFTGFIMVPISAGAVTTFTMVPIISQYEVYEVRDQESSEYLLLAHAKNAKRLSEQVTRFGGIMKELKDDKGKTRRNDRYLEALYYSRVQL